MVFFQLAIKCWEWDRFATDELIGSAKFNVGQLSQVPMWVELKSQNLVTAEINLVVSLKD